MTSSTHIGSMEASQADVNGFNWDDLHGFFE